ncbi:entry exclusion lipoprotein TrbK [Grimontia hollisae]|uniref:entry exclusion lipoprotein TrbK n=1 Tax=Grimontia hollisae TaxID=673 RepID=UPI001303DE2A|nr:entry exclusion lipoprotein TrbK [Grimontia hollisae]
MINRKTLMFVGFLTAVLAGCDSESEGHEVPKVNDANCHMEFINKIKDRAAREEFSGLCSRRSSVIAPTENPKNLLDLTDPKQE